MSAGEQMNVQMRDGFSSVGAVVDDGAKARFREAFLLRDDAHARKEVPEEGGLFRGRFRDARDELLRNKEEVDRGLGLDVSEAEAEVIFINDLGRNFTGDDLLKNGLRAHSSKVRWILRGELSGI